MNCCPTLIPDDYDRSKLDEIDRKGIERTEYLDKWEFAYLQEHATKTATIAMVANSCPLALLAWSVHPRFLGFRRRPLLMYDWMDRRIGEKMLVWSDPSTTPPLNLILSNISLYYLTNTFPTSLYHYRGLYGKNSVENKKQGHAGPDYLEKPTGYSMFPYDLAVIPMDLARTKINLVWGKRHTKGGHFAALEVPEDFWQDVDAFVRFSREEKII